jgi:putative copper export protein
MLFAADLLVRSLHLIAAAIWAGGLVMLAIAAVVARRTVPARERIAFFRDVGQSFLVLGGLALLVLLATGSELASDRDAWDILGEGTYGGTLLAKLILVGVVIVLTIVHSTILGPSLSRLREQALERPEDAELQSRIRRRAILSGIVSVLLLLCTLAILVLAARLVTG